MSRLSEKCICKRGKCKQKEHKIYQYAIIVATSEISANEGVPLINVGF